MMGAFSLVFVVSMVTVQCLVIDSAPKFNNGHVQGKVDSSNIDEASGLAASRTHANVVYTHNDKGGHPRIYALNADNGNLVATYNIQGAHNYDWEDIALGVCQDGNGYCIYIGEFGDHSGDGARNIIYRIREPNTVQNQDVDVDAELHFSWSEQDTETIMAAPSGDLYIISKVELDHHKKAKLGLIPASSWGMRSVVQLANVTTLNSITSSHSDPRGGDISPNGRDVLVKTKDAILYWQVDSGDYSRALQTPPTSLPYVHEHQGEAVCWDSIGSGYFTLGEGHNEPLYYYSRL